MKKTLLGILSVAAVLPAAADPYFAIATKHVDTGGEMLEYRNLAPAFAQLSRIVPKFTRQLSAQVTVPGGGALVGSALQTLFNALDLNSIKAFASSSTEVAPGIYVFKSFTAIAPDTRSILTCGVRENRVLDMARLPADTRLAVSAEVDFGYVWRRILEEAAATADPQLNDVLAQRERLKAHGVDVDALLAAVSGRLLLVISGSSAETLGLRLDIPDRTGALSAQLRRFMPPPPNGNMVQLPIPGELPFGRPQLVYAPGRIQLVSDARLLQPAAAALGSAPWFARFARHLPQKGTGYIVADMPKEVVDMLNAAVAASLGGDDHIALPPFRLVAVSGHVPDGDTKVAVSDFSIPALAITAPVAVQSTVLFKALRDAMNRTGRNAANHAETGEGSDLPAVASALARYAAAHQGVWPPDGPAGLTALMPYVNEAYVLEHKVFIGGGLKVAGLPGADRLPVVFDAPDDEGANVEVEVLFADGHVETVEVKNYTTAEQVISALNRKYRYSPAQLQDMLRRLKAR